ncbi:MAG: carboxypeptidase-like regulatory domain-containing protein [Nitrososphaera sp.]|jgi:hypothetical protein
MKLFVVLLTLSMIVVLSGIQPSNSLVSYHMVVNVKPEKTPIDTNSYPVIVGTVIDESSNPISNAKVKLSFEKQVVYTTTDDSGNFRYQSAIPSSDAGAYMINAVVSKDGYVTSYASSTYFVNPPLQTTVHKVYNLLPIVSGNYTMFLGKVTQWNLETTCFVKFGDEYKRFLKTCDLYNMEPNDFKTDQSVISSLTVMKYNDEYRLFPSKDYYAAADLDNMTQPQYLASTWANYTVPN